MAMNSTISPLLCVIAALLLSPVSCFFQHQPPPSDPPPALILPDEEKTRLGSTPPSCYNKCNRCHPCMAVQVPTLPSHDGLQPGPKSAVARPANFFDSSSPYSPGNRYTNYKPLGWKCQCGDHFYNP